MMVLMMLIGLAMLGVSAFSGAKKVRLLGIPPIVFEAIGAALASFSLGNVLGVRLWFLLFTGALVLGAVFVDPYIWSWQGDASENPRIESLVAGIMLGLIMFSTYLLGAWLA